MNLKNAIPKKHSHIKCNSKKHTIKHDSRGPRCVRSNKLLCRQFSTEQSIVMPETGIMVSGSA